MLLQKKTSFILIVLSVLGFSALVYSQTSGRPLGPNIPLMPLDQVKDGMKARAYTVFRGTEPEEFTIELLGIAPGAIGPKQDMIIGRLSGTNAERTQVFAGMSGSPVYVEGKLIGAVSYSFPFSKEPICGITPIEQMIGNIEPPTIKAASAQAIYSIPDLMGNDWRKVVSSPLSSAGSLNVIDPRSNSAKALAMLPIATPLTFSGVSQSVIDQFAGDFSAIGMKGVAVAGAGGGSRLMKKADDKTLIGGDSIVVQLASGDLSIAAAGTVTLRQGNKIHAFGHQYFALGGIELPMNESHVITVIPNMNNSFKIAVPDAMVGTMQQDRNTGIFGMLGVMPKMIPVDLEMTTSRGRVEKFHFESAVDDLFSPLIVNVGVMNAITSYERGLGDLTVDVSGQIDVKGEKPVIIERSFSGPQGGGMAAASPSIPLGALLRSSFPGIEISGVTLRIKIKEGTAFTVLERIEAERSNVDAGGAINLTLYLRDSKGVLQKKSVPVAMPADAQPGNYTLTVGDGATIQANDAVQSFTPRSTAELIQDLNGMKRPDKLYLSISRSAAGLVVNNSELPVLPPSVLATMNNSRSSGGPKSIDNTSIYETVIDTREIIQAGSQTVNITVVR